MGTGLSLPDFAVRTIVPKADIDALTRLAWAYDGDTYAADAYPENDAGTIPASGAPGATLPTPALTAALFSCGAPIVADPLNFATVNVYKRTAGGTRVLLATGATTPASLGSLNPRVLYALPLQSAAAALAFGDQVTVEIVKSGSGVVLPSLALALCYTPTFIDAALAQRWAWIWARLSKRYVETDPVTDETVLRWQTDMVTWDCYRKRGFSPGSAQDADGITGAKDAAEAGVLEAANGKDGLVELPLKPCGVSKGGPLAYTEQSPFVSADRQEREAVYEDAHGTGTYGGFGR